MTAVMAPFKDVTVGRLLTLLAEQQGDRAALLYTHAGLRWTFRQLNDEASRVARGLMASGVAPGDRVALWATNVPEWIVLQFALAKIGAILVTVNTSLRSAEIEYLLTQNETSTLITIRGFRGVDYLDELRKIGALGASEIRAARFPYLKRVIFIGAPSTDSGLPGPQSRAEDAPEGTTSYSAIREASG